VCRREAGIRIYATQAHGPGPEGAAARRVRLDRLVDAVLSLYAPVPAASLTFIVRRLRYATPHWHAEITSALQRARKRLAHAEIDGHQWFWPAEESMHTHEVEGVRFLAPFDPVVWDRRRFEHLWGWAYRFEAYTPVAKRVRGYYAMPLLYGDRVIGWANVSRAVGTGKLDVQLGFVRSRPRDRGFSRAVDAEVARMEAFLASEPGGD
jgi:uncharacterized protein YcaQ